MAIWVMDKNNQLKYANPLAVSLDLTISRLSSSKRVLDAKGNHYEILKRRDPNGNTVAIAFLCDSVTDIYRDLDRLKKFGSIGMVASQILHEVANKLSLCFGQIEIIESQWDDIEKNSDKIQKRLQKFKDNCDAVIKIFHGMKEALVSDVGLAEEAPCDNRLEKIIKDAISWISFRPQNEGVEIDNQLTPELLESLVAAAPTQMSQVVFNILNNACDALVGQKDRLITIKGQAKSDLVVITIEDNGPGIPEKVKASIFDEGFSTKDKRMGTGLGLPICRKLLEIHGGSIELCSKSKSTCFLIEIPLVTQR